MSRAAVYTMLSSDATLQSLGASFYAYQAVDTPPTKPFVVIRWDDTQPGVVRGRGPINVTFWVYDEPADYARIDSIISRIKTLLLGATHVAGSDGITLTTAQWRSDSQDLYDDVYECIMRQTSFTIVARPS